MKGIDKFFENRYIHIELPDYNFDACYAVASWEKSLYDEEGEFEGCSANFQISFPDRTLIYESGSGATRVEITEDRIIVIDITDTDDHSAKLADEVREAFETQPPPKNFMGMTWLYRVCMAEGLPYESKHGRVIAMFPYNSEASI
jgi:hypothetical protein